VEREIVMTKQKKSIVTAIAGGLIVAFALSACGVKGDLEAPPPKDEEQEAQLVLPHEASETA
jgi:predicted small lipoprotein YifL